MAKKPEEFADPAERSDFYTRTFEFPAGFMTQYEPSVLIGTGEHQSLATGFPIGKRFKSAHAVRVCDANPVHLGHLATADGRWRIYVFADAARAGEASKVTDLAEWLGSSPASPLSWTPEGGDEDAWFDLKVIHQQDHHSVELMEAPAVFKPRVGRFRLNHLEKVVAVDPARDIFAERGIDRGGVIVVVRPDQYVAHVLPLDATDELAAFFAPVFGRSEVSANA